MPSAGGEVHNPPPTALGHATYHQPGGQVRPRQIDRQHPLPLVQRRFEHAGVHADDGGGVDEDVDRAKEVDGGGVCGLQRLQRGHVNLQRHCPRITRIQLRYRPFGGGGVPVPNRNRPIVVGQAQGRGPPQPIGAPGHDG